MSDLVLHIGPPKTATTSLQHFFMKLDLPDFCYLGVFQPRDGRRSLATEIYQHINALEHEPQREPELRESIAAHLQDNSVVVVSEEMILLEGRSASIEQKLSRLFDLVAPFHPTTTFCVRDAEEVCFSHFVEMYRRLPKKLQLSFEEFQKSAYCDCFRYEQLYRKLGQIGFEKNNFFPFSDLVAGNLTVQEILGIERPGYDGKVCLTAENVTLSKNKELKVEMKKSVFENWVTKSLAVVPPVLIKNPVCKLFRPPVRRLFHLMRSRNSIKLERQEVLPETRAEYVNDLTFLSSLKR